MKSPVLGLRVAGTFAGLICLGQLARLLGRVSFVVAGHPVPFWLSAVAVLVAGGMCLWLWWLSLPAPSVPPKA